MFSFLLLLSIKYVILMCELKYTYYEGKIQSFKCSECHTKPVSQLQTAGLGKIDPDQNGGFQYGEPADSLVDIIAAPFRRALATKPRRIAAVSILCMTVITYLF